VLFDGLPNLSPLTSEPLPPRRPTLPDGSPEVQLLLADTNPVIRRALLEPLLPLRAPSEAPAREVREFFELLERTGDGDDEDDLEEDAGAECERAAQLAERERASELAERERASELAELAAREFALHRGASAGGAPGELRRSDPAAAAGREDPQFAPRGASAGGAPGDVAPPEQPTTTPAGPDDLSTLAASALAARLAPLPLASEPARQGEERAPALPESASEAARALAGCWSADERMMVLGGELVAVNVWFHLFEGGEAILSLRHNDHDPSRVHGRWWVDGSQLVVSFSGGCVRSEYTLADEVLRWAGSAMLRLPDATASIPFGIQLPYHLGIPSPGGPIPREA